MITRFSKNLHYLNLRIVQSLIQNKQIIQTSLIKELYLSLYLTALIKYTQQWLVFCRLELRAFKKLLVVDDYW